MMKHFASFRVAALSVCLAGTTFGQWTTQEIDLRPGWNAVFLHVQPEPADCDTIFSNAPFEVESVRAYNDAFSSVQFVQDVNALVPEGPPWISWFPADAEQSFGVNLFRLECGKAYFIKLPTNAPAATWAVVGRPVLMDVDWHASAFNLVGFEVNPTNPPGFSAFFSGSPEHAGQPIFRMNATGVWQRATGVEPMRNGEAFWTWLDEYSRYQGPIRIETDQRAGLDYGRTLMEQSLRIRNAFTNPLTVHLNRRQADPAPAGIEPVKAGDVPLSIWTTNGWQDLPDDVQREDIQPGEEWVVRLAVRRKDMTPYTPDPPGQEFSYQGLLEVTDDQNLSQRVIPVMAKGLEAFDADGNPINPSAGLWVGSVVINKVNQPSDTNNAAVPLPTASEFSFRAIVHVDTNNQARLLQHVLVMWKDGSYTNGAVHVPGRYVLVTDDSLADQFSGSTLRDGEQVGRRISSAAFGFRDPLPMAGLFGCSTNPLSCVVTTGFDDPLNPFKHLYHPDHDNLDARYSTNALGQGVESYTVTREIELAFTDEDPEGVTVAGWGDNQVGGVWRETIRGLRHQELRIEGFFRLQHASGVGVLNDGL
ncbi:MAG: hypothetical protein V1929_11670 [bacterium]